jgi:hypothetical protein
MVAELLTSLGATAGFLLLLTVAYVVGGAFVGGTFFPQPVGGPRETSPKPTGTVHSHPAQTSEWIPFVTAHQTCLPGGRD